MLRQSAALNPGSGGRCFLVGCQGVTTGESDGCLGPPRSSKPLSTLLVQGEVGSIPTLSVHRDSYMKGVIELTREEIFQLTALSSCAG